MLESFFYRKVAKINGALPHTHPPVSPTVALLVLFQSSRHFKEKGSVATIMRSLSCPALAQTTGHTFSKQVTIGVSDGQCCTRGSRPRNKQQACEQGGRAAGGGRGHVNQRVSTPDGKIQLRAIPSGQETGTGDRRVLL